jgi:hypothetical protein
VDTGSIDSRSQLGINARLRDRVFFDRHLTCAPLATQGYIELANYSNGNPTLAHYYYGTASTNYTFRYYIPLSISNTGCQVNVWEHRPGTKDLEWVPIIELTGNGGDTSIVFLEPNSVAHFAPNNDPVFRAQLYDGKMYKADRLVSPIACFQKYRFCNQDHRRCSP